MITSYAYYTLWFVFFHNNFLYYSLILYSKVIILPPRSISVVMRDSFFKAAHIWYKFFSAVNFFTINSFYYISISRTEPVKNIIRPDCNKPVTLNLPVYPVWAGTEPFESIVHVIQHILFNFSSAKCFLITPPAVAAAEESPSAVFSFSFFLSKSSSTN